MRLVSVLILFLISISCFAGSTWLRKSTYYVYDYIYDGEIIKQFDVPNRNGPSNSPLFLAKCAINRINLTLDEEGHSSTSDRVDIYCGKREVISIKNPKETNYFNENHIESEDKSWGVFTADSDSDVSGYAFLKSDGTLKLQDISKYGFLQGRIEQKTGVNSIKLIPNIKTENGQVIITGFALDKSKPTNMNRKTAILIITSDGAYTIKYQNEIK